jgi:hypothetical protein
MPTIFVRNGKFGISAAMAISMRLLVAQTPAGAPDSPTMPKFTDANPEIVRLVVQDQWDRGNDLFSGRQVKPLDGKEIWKNDEERHAAVRKLLAEGKLQSGKDYNFAALIFQHSDQSADLILAHTFAVTAVGKGESGARGLAAMTMDRYLWSVKQAQVFGTQFHPGNDGIMTMEPYDRTAVADGLRAVWCIVPLAEQERIEREVREGKPLRSTAISDCK